VQDKLFPSKFKWVVDSRFHLFLQDCRKSLDQEDVNNQIIDFNDFHKDVILQKLNIAAQASFSVVEPTTKSNNKPDQKKKSNNTLNNAKNKKGKRKNGGEGRNKEGKKKFLSVENTNQIAEFKMKEGETWEKFQGKCINFHIKLGTNIMCPRFHTKGRCHNECKFATTHLPANDIPADVREKYCGYLKIIGSWNRSPGWGLAVPDPDLHQNPPTSNQSYHHLSSWGQKGGIQKY
jgi:hypothetical protein